MTRTPKPKALLLTALVVLAVAAWSTVQAAEGDEAPPKQPSPETTAAGNETGNGTQEPAPHAHEDCGDHGHHGTPPQQEPRVQLLMGPEYQQKKVAPGETIGFVIKLFVNSSKPETVLIQATSYDSSGLVGRWSYNVSATSLEVQGYAYVDVKVTAPLVPHPSATMFKVALMGSIEGVAGTQRNATVVATMT